MQDLVPKRKYLVDVNNKFKFIAKTIYSSLDNNNYSKTYTSSKARNLKPFFGSEQIRVPFSCSESNPNLRL